MAITVVEIKMVIADNNLEDEVFVEETRESIDIGI